MAKGKSPVNLQPNRDGGELVSLKQLVASLPPELLLKAGLAALQASDSTIPIDSTGAGIIGAALLADDRLRKAVLDEAPGLRKRFSEDRGVRAALETDIIQRILARDEDLTAFIIDNLARQGVEPDTARELIKKENAIVYLQQELGDAIIRQKRAQHDAKQANKAAKAQIREAQIEKDQLQAEVIKERRHKRRFATLAGGLTLATGLLGYQARQQEQKPDGSKADAAITRRETLQPVMYLFDSLSNEPDLQARLQADPVAPLENLVEFYKEYGMRNSNALMLQEALALLKEGGKERAAQLLHDVARSIRDHLSVPSPFGGFIGKVSGEFQPNPDVPQRRLANNLDTLANAIQGREMSKVEKLQKEQPGGQGRRR